jgi:hypothetical protein
MGTREPAHGQRVINPTTYFLESEMNYFKCLELEYWMLQRPTPIPLWPEQITDEMVNAAYLAHDDMACREPMRPALEAALRAAPKQAKFGGEMMKIERAARLARDAMSAVLTQRDWHLDTDLLFGDLETALEALNEAIPQQPEPVQANFPEGKLQTVAECIGDKCEVWRGIGARDVEEILRQALRLGLVTPQQAGPVAEPTFFVRTGCRVCGVGDGGKAMGYVCPRSDCPMKVTCGGAV